jgi:glycosyltransferase involved in cell wall biosynthesis
MKILMLSWRDMKNPLKGGAEIVTDTYLQELIKLGNECTLFSSEFIGCKKEEKFNDYKIIRKGGKLGVYPYGLLYAKKHENEFDIIIDQVNTIPFFTPLLISKKKRIALFHQLCLNVWFWETPLPIAITGYLLENLFLKLYWNTKSVCVSNSTKQDLVKYAWMNPKNVLILENQIDFKPLIKIPKKENCFVFCGRLKKSKRVHDCIKAMSLIKDKKTKLFVVGDGDNHYKDYLNQLIQKLGLKDRVFLLGKLSFEERNKVMAKSRTILVTSIREGWGLIVTEANANGTIAITYDIEGLRDANKTGLICEKNNPETLANQMNFVLNNEEKIKEMSEKALKDAKEHSNWSKKILELNKWLNH